MLLGIDEEADPDACVLEPAHQGRQPIGKPVGVEAALGGELGAALRHHADLVGPNAHRQLDHLIDRRQLLIKMDAKFAAQAKKIVILDVAAVFAQMDRDRIGAGALRQPRRLDRIGIEREPRLPHGGDVIDVDPQPRHRASGAGANVALDRGSDLARNRRDGPRVVTLDHHARDHLGPGVAH